MHTISLGDGLQTSALGFGAMAVTHVYGGADDHAALGVLNAAVDTGVTFIDTADVYGEPEPGTTGPAGTNEKLVARLLADRRDEVTLATKFGITGLGGTEGAKATRGDADYVRASCDASLRRLGTDVIDLWYLHRRDPDVPVAETVAAMAEMVGAGKVRHLGLSEVTASELREAHAVHPIAAVQSEWSVWSRDVETNVVPACAELGVGFVPYSPLGRGFLTGTLTRDQVAADRRGSTARIGDNWDANQRVLAVVADVASRLGVTNAQAVLAWLHAAGERAGVATAPIPGTRSPHRLAENAAAVDVVLDADAIAALDSIADLVAGGRNIAADPAWISAGRE
ncbi:aldo/keto reductase [Gordonia humi]|uniref:Aryl-alcohol dehydrogenase-like predicted oxidoreductase n=1 Tax=Gordonia humi TaxID=686429 RepID=A0A840F8A8_9ACTN|nr:aldo/keto reductase [Gordonia humi]MBB4137819.1 aryl-alcohol dehydrogenase-like predicted oxidoreductase [Gordonia humi]